MYPLPCTRNDGKASYYCAVVWVQNPDDIAKEGVLCLEEIPDRPPAAWHFVDPGTADLSHPYQMPLTCTCLLPWDSAPTLDSDTELTYLPPGLLDSPPHPTPHPSIPNATDLQRLCTTVLIAPVAPILITPCISAVDKGTSLATPMRCSKRIAAKPPSSAMPAEWARDTKLKKLGLPATHEDSKAYKKDKLLQGYMGDHPDMADVVLSELLAVQFA
jgi:hypothetical protein